MTKIEVIQRISAALDVEVRDLTGVDLSFRLEHPPSESSIKLGNRIKEARATAGLTQKDLADRMQVSTGFINLMEAGHGAFDALNDIAAALGTDSKTLAGDLLEKMFAPLFAKIRETAQIIEPIYNKLDYLIRILPVDDVQALLAMAEHLAEKNLSDAGGDIYKGLENPRSLVCPDEE